MTLILYLRIPNHVGWSNTPGEPILSISDLVEKSIYNKDVYGAIFNVSWEAPSYLGGLDNVMYKIIKNDYDDDGAISTKEYLSTEAHLSVDTTVGLDNELTISISVVTAHNDNSQFVSPMSVKKKFKEIDLYEAVIGKKLSLLLHKCVQSVSF